MQDADDRKKEIFSRIRRIEIQSRKLVESLFSGGYHSAFKGSGIEFAEVRPYQEGDDVRSIDWNVTARTGHPYVKLFDEERELTVILMVDASASGYFGTGENFKTETAAEICATISFSAIKNGDKVGLLIFTDHVELFIPPSKGSKHVLRIIREILYFRPAGKKTDLTNALENLNSAVKRRTIVFLISDFEADGYEKPLRAAARRHDLIAVEVYDPAEKTLPDAGLVSLIDSETGEEIIVDSSDEDFRRRYEEEITRRGEKLKKLFGRYGIDRIRIRTDLPPVEPLIKFFRKREKRLAAHG